MTPALVAVLAAGVGSRLRDATGGGAKWLVEVGADRIVDLHLDAFEQLGTPVVVVTGHAGDEVAAHVNSRMPSATILHNEEHRSRNNWYSALLALRHAEAVAPDRTPVLVNCDLWARPEWIAATVLAVVERGGAALAVDTERPLTDEAMKVACDAAGDVTAIGKQGVADPVGEYVGILAVAPRERRAYVAALAALGDDPARSNDWYENAIGDAVAGGMRWTTVAVPDAGWVEIDDVVDLRVAESLGGTGG